MKTNEETKKAQTANQTKTCDHPTGTPLAAEAYIRQPMYNIEWWVK